MRGFLLVGAPRFELGTSSPPDWRANQAAPRPVRPIVAERVTKLNLGDPAHQGGTVLQRETRLTAVASNHFWPSKLARKNAADAETRVRSRPQPALGNHRIGELTEHVVKAGAAAAATACHALLL
jgi:hypothetical protein